MNKKINNSEIDVFEFIINLWNNKFKIILITLVFISIALFYQLYQSSLKKPISKINTKTEILPISTDDETKYDAYNFFITNKYDIGGLDFNGKKIEKLYLLNLFIDTIRKNKFLSNIIKESKLIKKENYTNNNEYENKVNQLLKSIKFIQPVYDLKSGKQLSDWQIQFLTDDIDAWKNFLKLLSDSTNREVQSIIRDNFKAYINNKKKIHQYKIEDLDALISNTLEIHEIETENRIAFLIEQAAIARELEISKSNIEIGLLETKIYTNENGMVTNFTTDKHYYMRGYEMIEKEIALIKERKNPQSFNEKLMKLKFQKKKLLQDKEIERIQNIFQDTPIIKSDEFYAARIMSEKIIYGDGNLKKKNILKSIYLTGIVGLIFGILYVMFFLEVQKRNNILRKK